MMDALVRVKCLGGRELQGTLRGYDELVNLVLDDCDEYLRGMFVPSVLSWPVLVSLVFGPLLA